MAYYNFFQLAPDSQTRGAIHTCIILSVGTVTTSDRKSLAICRCAFFNFCVDVYLKVGPSSAVISLFVPVDVDFFSATEVPGTSLIMLGAMTATSRFCFRLKITEKEGKEDAKQSEQLQASLSYPYVNNK